MFHLGGWQNEGPFLGTLNIRCRTILGTQKETLILTTTHLELGALGCWYISWLFLLPCLEGVEGEGGCSGLGFKVPGFSV